MNKKTSRRLGKGLSVLIPTEEDGVSPGSENEVVELNSLKIVPNRFQPRKDFDEEEITNLARSIATHGLLQPILVRQKTADQYEIISGERRFRAMQFLGREKIPSVVRLRISDREMKEMALVENIQREDLNDIDKAEAYQQLIADHDYSHEQLADQIGKSRTAITNTLRLLNLPDEIKAMVRNRSLSMGHARALLAIEDSAQRILLANRAIRENLSVREIENAAQAGAARKPKKTKLQAVLDPNLTETVSKLQYKLGTPVNLQRKDGKRGKLTIEFFSEADLIRIIDLLLT